MSADVLAAGLAAHDAGIVVVPTDNRGTKRPRCYPIPPGCTDLACRAALERAKAEGKRAAWGWAHLRHAPMSRGRLAAELRHADGLCFLTGTDSGYLLLLESDDVDAADALRDAARHRRIGHIMRRLDDGYQEATPSGGTHWLLRLDLPTGELMPGNQKLAARPKRADERRDEHDGVQVLIETRGEGGQVVVAPSRGRTHPSGRPYVLVAGGIDTVPTLGFEEWCELVAAARTLDEMPAPALTKRHTAPAQPRGGETPMERFNRAATWGEILEPHGWTLFADHGNGRQEWKRPGKRRHGVSATTLDDGPLYVFSTSTVFEADRAYSKFAAYAVLRHGGDMSAAARTLRAWHAHVDGNRNGAA